MPCLRPGTALLFNLLKVSQGHDLFFFFVRNFKENLRFSALRPFFFFFFVERLKFREQFAIFLSEDLFFENTDELCPWFLVLASSIPVLGLESVCPRKVGPWP